jgi:GNAT superfamily N-acetyltransferase
MPVADDPTRGPNGRVLLDSAGVPVGSYEHGLRDGVPIADLFEWTPGVGVEEAAAAVLADLRGMKIAGDVELGRALVAAGGKATRHGHMYSYDLRRKPPPDTWDEPPGVRLTDFDRPVADMIPSRRAAYPPGHPDHGAVPEDMETELMTYTEGQFGPLLPGSGLAVADDGAVVGGIILGTLPGDPPLNGPWIIDVWRDPAHRGVGRALLQRALALAPIATLGLIVTEGNDTARRMYEAVGFELIASALVVQL